MDHQPDEQARQQMQFKPSMNPSSKEEQEREIQRTRSMQPHPLERLKITPENRARQALGLAPKDPTPRPKGLDPALEKAIEALDPKSREQVLAVMGCVQEFQQRTQALTQKVNERMGSALERTRQVSLAQRSIIRRAHKGTLGQQDLDRADGIIHTSAETGAMDAKTLGLHDLYAQREELVGAVKDIRQVLIALIPEAVENGMDERAGALAFVDQSMTQQAADVSLTVDRSFAQYQQSDRERIEAIVQGQRQLDISTPTPIVRQVAGLGTSLG